MGNGLFSQLYGKRVAGRPYFGGSGNIEENDAPGSGTRIHHATYTFGKNITGFARVVIATTLVDTVNPIAAPIAQPFPGVPMTLTCSILGAGTGSRSVTVRIYGINQFFQPLTEDFRFVNRAGAMVSVAGQVAFVRVDRIEYLAGSQLSVGFPDQLSVGATIGGNGIGTPSNFRLGLPCRLTTPVAPAVQVADIISATVLRYTAAGAIDAEADLRLLSPLAVNGTHATVDINIPGIYADGDGTRYVVNLTINTRLSTGDVSDRAGYIPNR